MKFSERTAYRYLIDEIEVVALDGKTIRRSNTTKGKKGAHIVSAWADRLGITLAQVKVDEKSNEITAVPELPELMDLKCVIVTIDAMGCQKKIVEKITEKKSDYLISFKGIKTVDVRCFITSLTNVETAAKSMRSHWGIENNLHWTLDMMYNEDYTRSRKDHSPQNPAVLRKIALNLFKTAPNPTGKANFSLHKKQITCMCNDDYLKTMLQMV